MATLNVDTINNSAGTGSPDFANGLKNSGASFVEVHTGNGFGSTNTKIRRFSTVAFNVGSDITYADSATNGGSFTINTTGIYAIGYTDRKNSGASSELMGISRNGTGTASYASQIATAGVALVHTTVDISNGPDVSCSAVVRLAAGDVVRAHVDLTDGGYGLQNEGRNKFYIHLLYKL